MKEFSEHFEFNRIEEGTGDFALIASGVSYQYAKESFPDAPILKISMPYPLPENMIREFTSKYKKIYVVEENDPFIENQIKAMGIDNIHGKDTIPQIGELNQYIVKNRFLMKRMMSISVWIQIYRQGHLHFVPDAPIRVSSTHCISTSILLREISVATHSVLYHLLTQWIHAWIWEQV